MASFSHFLCVLCILQILTALRAIGNAGQSGAVDTLNTCLHYRVPMEVRVAAAQAFRRMPCDADVSTLIMINMSL